MMKYLSVKSQGWCSDCNFSIKKAHHRFVLGYVPETRIKREKVFHLRGKLYGGPAS